jgi:hypothetical protein
MVKRSSKTHIQNASVIDPLGVTCILGGGRFQCAENRVRYNVTRFFVCVFGLRFSCASTSRTNQLHYSDMKKAY